MNGVLKTGMVFTVASLYTSKLVSFSYTMSAIPSVFKCLFITFLWVSLTELRHWPPASSKICIGQRGEKGEGGFAFVGRGRVQLLCYFVFCLVYNGCKSSTIIIGAIKLKNQNYVLNIIFFFLNCDFSCETKTMYQTEFFLQSWI